MSTINIAGCRVEVSDSFMQLSKEQQNATVDKIATALGITGPTVTETSCFSTKILDFAQWWLGLFGVFDPEHVKLTVTLVASALLLALLYAALLLIMLAVGGILSLLGTK
jgi:hypothetical protein